MAGAGNEVTGTGFDAPGPALARARNVVDLGSLRTVAWAMPDERTAAALDEALETVERGLGAAGGPVFVPTTPEILAGPRRGERLAAAAVELVPRISADELGDRPTQILATLRELGVRIAVDDATADVVSRLETVAPDFVFVHQRLVAAAETHAEARAAIRSLLTFADASGIDLVADGVVSEPQRELLQGLGVVHGMGPRFEQPIGDRSHRSGHVRRTRLGEDTVDPLDALESATTLAEVFDLVCSVLHRPGCQASAYVERNGLLRCVAQRGRGHLLDGVPVHAGPLGQVFRSARPQTLVSAPGASLGANDATPIQLILPVRVDGRVVGVVDLAIAEGVPSLVMGQATRVVTAAEARLSDIGREPPTVLSRLVAAIDELGALDDRRQVELASTRLACEVAKLSSAMLATTDSRGNLVVSSVQGPLAAALQKLESSALQELLVELGSASSLFAVAVDAWTTQIAVQLHAAGASTAAAFPVRAGGDRQGLLIVADHAPVALSRNRREAVEALARQVGHRLDLVSALADLRVQATVDPLTGLGNVAAFQDAVAAVGGRRRGQWGILLADVDGLKRVNDSQGHQAGDRLLRRVAATLDDVLRADDRMFRIGGDEFAALLHDVDAEGAGDVGWRMCQAAESVLHEFGAGLSIGIAIPEAGETSSDFIGRADAMLYEVKRTQPGSVLVAPPLGGSAS